MQKKWTKEEVEVLKEHYPQKGKKWCAERLGKTEGSVRYKASSLGLRQDRNSEFFKDWQKRAAESKVGKKRPDHSKLMKQYAKQGRLPVLTQERTEEYREKSSRKMKAKWQKEGHPKGFKGKTHGKEAKEKMSKASKKMWGDKDHVINSEEYRQMLSDRGKVMYKNGKLKIGYSRGRSGTYNINGLEIYLRSLWEANYALYLDWLISQNQIQKWEYEVDVFWFEKIKRGVRSYKPDFKVYNMDGSIEYHEVKGWMDAKSKTKLKRMRIYYPEVKMVLIDEKAYKAIKKSMGSILSFFK